MSIRITREVCRILLLAPEGMAGGIATWTRHLLKYTDRQIIDYHVINTSKFYDTLGKRLGIRGALCGVRDSIKRLANIISQVYRFRPHAVYFTCAPSIGFIVRDMPYMLLLRLLRKKYIVHFRGGRLNYFFGRNAIERFIVRWALGGALILIAITRAVEDKAKEIFGPDKVCYLPNMIDDELVSIFPEKVIKPAGTNTEPMRVLHVAWQAPEKGSLELVDALGKVQSPFLCDLVGDIAAENRRLIQDRIRLKGLEGKVAITGKKSGDELNDYFKKADLFVFPSHNEGFPNVILEAMASGLPILASDVGNIREMIDAEGVSPAGMLLDRVNPIDVDELAEKIDLLLRNYQLRMDFSRNGRERVRNSYTASKVVPQLEQKIIETIENRTR